MKRAQGSRQALVISALALVAWSSDVRAHLGGAEGLMPFVADGALFGAGTTRGLVSTSNAAAGFLQTCEESVGALPRAFVRLAPENLDDEPVILVASALGVASTVDRGCTWTPVEGTAARDVMTLVASTTTAAVWATANPGPASPVDVQSAVLVSRDRGRRFDVAYAAEPQVVLTSLAVGAGEVSGDRVLVGGVNVETRAPLLWTALSTPGHNTAPVPIVVDDDAQLAIALAIDDDGLWFSTLDRIGRGHLWRVAINDAGIDGDSAGLAGTEVGSFDGVVRATARVGGHRFVIAAGDVLHRAPAADPGTFTRTTDGPLRCLLTVPGDERLWGCGTQPAGTFFRATSDGETWVDVLPFDTVEEMACPSGTPAAAACAYRFDFEEPPPPPMASLPSEGPGTGCGQFAADQYLAVHITIAAVFALRGRQRRRF